MPLFRGNQAPTKHQGVARRKDHAGAQSAFGENPIETGCARAGRAMPFDLKTASLRLKKKYSEPGTQLAAKSADARGEQMAKHVIFLGGRRAQTRHPDRCCNPRGAKALPVRFGLSPSARNNHRDC